MILVVDDHVDTAFVMCRLLESRGYNATCCHDGHEALSRIKWDTPQLVILDLQMPFLTGVEVLEQMQGDDWLKRVPVIIYSANSDEEIQAIALKLGAKEYWVKTAIGPEEIIAAVERHVGEVPGGAEEGSPWTIAP